MTKPRYQVKIKIKKATNKDMKEALKIARNLKEWFNKEGLKNMKIDFNLNNLVIAIENKKIIGFLCYTTYCGRMLLMWMGIKREYQRKGIGEKLLKWLEKEAKRLNLHTIEVETLPDEDNYEPYKITRNFYYKHGFKRLYLKKAIKEGWDDQIVMEKRIK